ncbi:MAG TPA: hypothetical protein VE441_14890 [Mycobacterium sp.]|nr:hypothetical protein [Mycobacterium sp.]
MRYFRLNRREDPSGVSGTGIVATGIEYDTGQAVVTWLGEWPTVDIHLRGLESVEHLHGHGGSTVIEWTTGPDSALPILTRGMNDDLLS